MRRLAPFNVAQLRITFEPDTRVKYTYTYLDSAGNRVTENAVIDRHAAAGFCRLIEGTEMRSTV